MFAHTCAFEFAIVYATQCEEPGGPGSLCLEDDAMNILYLCDRKVPKCAGHVGCGDPCIHTTDPEHAVNGPCRDPVRNDRFRTQSGSAPDELVYVEFEDIYHSGKPPAEGWYDCLDKDGQQHRLHFFQCNLNRKKYYYTDLQGQVFGKPEDGIRWTGKASAFR